jgi:hypothetical protein
LAKTPKTEIERMLKNSQTKVIAPIITLGLVSQYSATKNTTFSDADIRKAYGVAVGQMKAFLGHDLHIGAKYYDAYGSRMSRYGVLEQVDHLRYRLLPPYTDQAQSLVEWIPGLIKKHIDERMGIVPHLQEPTGRAKLAESQGHFEELIREHIAKTPANFEIFSFAVVKAHLEKFACKIYRDTRTSAHDKGVDLSTNFGVVYQVKKLRIHTKKEAAQVYAELKLNFDKHRLQDGNVILVIDDISREVKQYLIDMKVQSISKDEILRMVANFDEQEDRQKVLRIIYEEFRREYSSRIS